jgi:serine/threonine-protein kinase
VKTQTGVLLGSPKYMSPEQVLGRPVNHRSDIFSLGVVLYEMLAGTVPFSGSDLTQLMFQVVNGAALPPSRVNPAVPDVLDFIVAKALDKNPDKRYADAGEMAADLRACRDALPDAPPMEMDMPVEATRPDAAGTLAVSMTPATASLGLPLSTHLDSARALSRLESPSSADRLLTSPTPPASTPFRRLREDTDLLSAVALLGSVGVGALIIAFI